MIGKQLTAICIATQSQTQSSRPAGGLWRDNPGMLIGSAAVNLRCSLPCQSQCQ